VSGLVLANHFYQRVVRPLLTDRPHSAALLGDGSEVLGFDDDVSTDHDFGPRVQIFVANDDDAAAVTALLIGLPATFEEFPVAFPDGSHGVEVTTVQAYFTFRLGVDPAYGLSVADWLLTPTQILASLTAGAVFHDPDDALSRRREALRWYPDDVWRYVLAAAWLRIEQEDAFVGRTGGLGDDLGSRIVAARLTRDLVRLAFLVRRRWAPYSKWLGRAFADLPPATDLSGHLASALAAGDWREREASLCAAASILAAATNELGLCEPVDVGPRRFHTRDIRVIGAERFTTALTDAITDRDVRAILTRLGCRPGTRLGNLPGSVDQAVDSADVLCQADRCRSTARTLGLVD